MRPRHPVGVPEQRRPTWLDHESSATAVSLAPESSEAERTDGEVVSVAHLAVLAAVPLSSVLLYLAATGVVALALWFIISDAAAIRRNRKNRKDAP